MSNQERAKQIQEILRDAGFYDGKIDADLGRASLRAFNELGKAARAESKSGPVSQGIRGYANVGKVWTIPEFREYLKTIKPPDWIEGVCMHHTGLPNLKIRPNGETVQHMIDRRDSHYIGKLGWSEGPHLFTDDDQILGMTDLRIQGTHAPSFNSNCIGIEVLGDYDSESHDSGRGLSCWLMGAGAAAAVLDWLGLPANETTVRFHRECRVTMRTTKKTCPGKLISKQWVLGLIKAERGLPR
jgi:hypothetical protein